MNEDQITLFLSQALEQAEERVAKAGEIQSGLPMHVRAMLDVVLHRSEASKGVLTVTLTSVVYKILHPEQDIRYHQSDMPNGNGYSGRSFDTKFITPFLKEHRFPSMAESGWLTRSLEQKSPYTLNYRGAIQPKTLKDAFLGILDSIEGGRINPADAMDYMFQYLVIQRDTKNIMLARPQNLQIREAVRLLDCHFHQPYKTTGAARLPVLALYALYEILVNKLSDKKLLPLAKHTSADRQSGRLGDIDILDRDDSACEAIEIKFDIPISHEMALRAIDKIQPTTLHRYYILSTAEVASADIPLIDEDIKKIKSIHGCELIVNGVMPTLKYLLRIVNDTRQFIAGYVRLMEQDEAIKYEHKLAWNELVSNL